MSTIELSVTAKTYREIQSEIKELEAQADALTVGEYTLRYTIYESSRLDTSKLKAEHGDIYAAYSKRTTATRFQVA